MDESPHIPKQPKMSHGEATETETETETEWDLTLD